MKKKWKLILLGLAGIIILLITIFNLTRGIEAKLLEVKPKSIANTFEEEGKVIPQVQLPIYTLNSQKIVDLMVNEGQEVQEGDVLVVLDTTELDYQLKQLQGQLESVQGEQVQNQYETLLTSQELQLQQARLDLNFAQTNLKRIEELYNLGATTKKELEEAQKAKELARINFEKQQEALRVLKESRSASGGTTQFYAGRLKAMEAQVEYLQYQIEQSTKRAPVKGTVANIALKKGELAQPGVPMMNIFQADAYQVEVFVLAEDVYAIKEGMEVSLTQKRNDKDIVLEGKVKEISPSAVEKLSALGLEEQRVKVIIDIVQANNLKVFPELRLDVEFTTDKREDQLVVPKTVLFPYKEGEALWLVKGGKAIIQPVETGFETDRHIVIETGLVEGDLVILNPQLEGLAEGEKIKG